MDKHESALKRIQAVVHARLSEVEARPSADEALREGGVVAVVANVREGSVLLATCLDEISAILDEVLDK